MWILWSVWRAIRRRWQKRQPDTAWPSAEGAQHEAVVLDVRPSEGDDYEPYFIGQCDCGWLGEFHDQLQPALEEARSHGGGTNPRVIRPVA